VRAVTDEAGDRRRLAQALAADTGSRVFDMWGFHHYFHVAEPGAARRNVTDPAGSRVAPLSP
jgi:hypothetical protein